MGKDKFNSADGRRGGNLYLLYTLHSNSDGENIRKAPFLEALTMLMHTEGFANAIVGYPAAEMTKRYAERKVAINNARATVRYLIAVEKISAKKRRMKFARLFMIQVGAFGHYSSDPLLQKNWESYKRNSPILYALFKEPTFDPEKFQKLSWAVKWVDATARDREAILRILGVAASVADMIKKVTKRFDVSIYSRVARVPWHDESFTAQERDFVIQL